MDTIELSVKKEKEKEIIDSYKCFGWEIKDTKEDKMYDDITRLKFSRPHKIQNKDELQLLQVYLENNINKLGKLESFKHKKSTLFGLTFGPIGICSLTLGILNLCSIISYFNTLVSILLISVGAIFISLTAVFIPLLLKKEKIKFTLETEKIKNENKQILTKTQNLIKAGDNE